MDTSNSSTDPMKKLGDFKIMDLVSKGAGSEEHCAHGNGMVLKKKVLEWAPYARYTTQWLPGAGFTSPPPLVQSFAFDPIADGTRVTMTVRVINRNPIRLFITKFVFAMVGRGFSKDVTRLRARLAAPQLAGPS